MSTILLVQNAAMPCCECKTPFTDILQRILPFVYLHNKCQHLVQVKLDFFM